MSIIDWLHRRIFRGVGLVFLLAILTILALALMHVANVERLSSPRSTIAPAK